MFGLPESTCLRKQISKTLIYDKFATELSSARKKSFENEVSKIFVVNEISPASVNLKAGDSVSAIFGVLVELKNKNFDEKNILLLHKLFGQNLFFVIHYENQYKLAIYQTKLFQTDWIGEEDKTLRLDGLDLDRVWQNMVTQISGIIPQKGRTLDEQINVEIEKEKIRKQIAEIETKAAKENQSKKKFELHQRLIEYKKQLEEM